MLHVPRAIVYIIKIFDQELINRKIVLLVKGIKIVILNKYYQYILMNIDWNEYFGLQNQKKAMTATRKKILYAAPMAWTDLNIRTKKVRRGSNFFLNLSSQNKVFVIGIKKKKYSKRSILTNIQLYFGHSLIFCY